MDSSNAIKVSAEVLDQWPDERRREPPISSSSYLVLKPLAGMLKKIASQSSDKGWESCVDIGCGTKPYYPYFAAVVNRYIGIDMPGVCNADVYGDASSIPLADCCVDLVLCLQVLEHVDQPESVLSDIYRILKPGGTLLLSTHGTMVYHPYPRDLWRWTHKGLIQLTERAGFRVLQIAPCGGNGSALGFLLATQIELLLSEGIMRRVIRRVVVPTVNLMALAYDRLTSALAFTDPYSISANYLVEASKPRL